MQLLLGCLLGSRGFERVGILLGREKFAEGYCEKDYGEEKSEHDGLREDGWGWGGGEEG